MVVNNQVRNDFDTGLGNEYLLRLEEVLEEISVILLFNLLLRYLI